MKRYIFVFIFAFFCTYFADTQSCGPPNRSVKWNAIHLYLNRLSLGYEWAFRDHTSILTWLDYGRRSVLEQRFWHNEMGINLELRYYFLGRYIEGLYVTPYAVMRYKHNVGDLYDGRPTPYAPLAIQVQGNHWDYSGGMQVGYQYIIDNQFVMDMFVGTGYYHWGDPGAKDAANVLLRLGFCLGYAY